MTKRYEMSATKTGPTGQPVEAVVVIYQHTPELARGVAESAGYGVAGPAREAPLYEPGTYGPDAIAIRGKSKEK